MLTYGFYSSVNHDRAYNSTQLSSLFDGIIKDGIFETIGNALIVQALSDTTVVVQTGKAWFNHTWTYNDTLYPLTAEASEVVLDRIDAVVIEINANEDTRANSLKIVKGTPSSTPVKPTLISTDSVHQYPLAYLYRTANSTTISQADITNAVGTSECPFISGVMQTISLDEVLGQWQAELNDFTESEETDFTAWMTIQKAEFTAWFENLQIQLDGDVATNLQNQINHRPLASMLNTITEEGFAIDARQGNPSVTGTIAYNLLKNAGQWITDDITIPSGSTSYTVSNSMITADSAIDIYYDENSKEVVSNAVDSYPSNLQVAGSFVIQFSTAISADVVIKKIRVVG